MRLRLIMFVLLVMVFPLECTLMESLEDSLASLKSYTQSVLPYLASALRTLKRVDDFVESTIAEECVYTCPNKKHVAVAKSGHVGSSNGCGSFDLFVDSTSSFIKVEPAFIECCNHHDLCYDTCASDKDECDLSFKKCLYNVCKSKEMWNEKKTCKAKAKAAFVTVLGVGCQSFLEAQKEACVCVPKRKTFSDEL